MSKIGSIVRTSLDIRRDIPLAKASRLLIGPEVARQAVDKLKTN